MLINRTHAKIAASWQRNLSMGKTAQQSAQQIVGGAHMPYQVIRGYRRNNMTAVDFQGGFIHHADNNAHFL